MDSAVNCTSGIGVVVVLNPEKLFQNLIDYNTTVVYIGLHGMVVAAVVFVNSVCYSLDCSLV
jgi:hypothetical protein